MATIYKVTPRSGEYLVPAWSRPGDMWHSDVSRLWTQRGKALAGVAEQVLRATLKQDVPRFFTVASGFPSTEAANEESAQVYMRFGGDDEVPPALFTMRSNGPGARFTYAVADLLIPVHLDDRTRLDAIAAAGRRAEDWYDRVMSAVFDVALPERWVAAHFGWYGATGVEQPTEWDELAKKLRWDVGALLLD